MLNRKILILLISSFFAFAPCGAEVIAPALQYLREDYPSAFLSQEDYHIKLNTTRRYKLRCQGQITAVAIGDIENLKAFANDIIIKTRRETYTYMQIYTDTVIPVTVLVSINAKNEVPPLIRFGGCTMFEDVI